MMMKKNWKNRSAVSPVIATILMVAITVVLAAVLYVMVMGFGSGPSQTPTASLTQRSEGTLKYNVTVSSITSNSVPLTSVEVLVSGTSNPTATALTHLGSGTNIAAGDYVVVTAAKAGSVTVTIRDTATSNTIGSITFTAA